MRTIRTRITAMTIIAVVMSVAVVSVMSVVFIRRTEHCKSDRILLMLCETGERNLNYYFDGVQRSVEKVASYAKTDLAGTDMDQFAAHMDRVRDYFNTIASRTEGVLTYYYRIDPSFSDTIPGFWYMDLDGEGFTEHKVTDISLYDTEDTSQLIWFTIPRKTGEPIWLPPYITDNLDKEVISYNVPISRKGEFAGVIGIEIDYATMAKQVDNIRVYNNGYAFINDDEGNIFYHPNIDVTLMTEETKPSIPDGLLSRDTFLRYRYQGVDKQGAWLPLSNGMRLNVVAPISETEGDWKRLIWNVVLHAVGVIILTSLFAMLYTRRITTPLKELTEAAERLDSGDYNFDLKYDKDDEIGRLTRTFKLLSSHVRDHITDLNDKINTDALTMVKNKGAFSSAVRDLQKKIEEAREETEFAICVFDCDDLKNINDSYGHEKGDMYLKKASGLICKTFMHSPVYRVGGDEFSVILQNEDYLNRYALLQQFEKSGSDINATSEIPWEQVHVSAGLAVYDPNNDVTAYDVARRADRKMYKNKQKGKDGKERRENAETIT